MEFSSNFFEEASKAWRSNKIPLENGMFRYKEDAFDVSQNSTNDHISGRTRSGRKYKK